MNRVLTRYLLRQSNPSAAPRAQGFTLIELLVVIVIVAVAAAIAAPSWLAFSNRQRVNKAADRLVSALQEARTKAKQTKQFYRLTFRNYNGEIQYSIVPATVPVSSISNDVANPADPDRNAWKPILSTQRDGIRPKLLFACTNLVAVTTTQNAVESLPNQIDGLTCNNYSPANTDANTDIIRGASATSLHSIVFSPSGGLPLNSLNSVTALPANETSRIFITIGLNRSANEINSSQLIPSTRRCVFIDTLLSSVRTARDAACPSS